MNSSKDLRDYPPMLTVPDVQKMLRIGRSAAYKMVARGYQERSFPVIKVGDTYRIPRDAFIGWLEEYNSGVRAWGTRRREAR